MLNSGAKAKHGEHDTGVVFQRVGDFGVITMNRSKALNALNLPMIRAMRPQLAKWKTDTGVHAVIIKSSSEKAFCAGGDVVAIAKDLREPPARGERVSERFFFEEYQVNHAIGTFGKPYIALIDGVCMGGVRASLQVINPFGSTCRIRALSLIPCPFPVSLITEVHRLRR